MDSDVERAPRAPGWQQGFADALAQAFSLVATPMLFGFLGWWLDRVTGLAPVFVVTLSVFAVVGMFVTTWLQYKARMEQIEAGQPWNRRP